MSPSIVKSGRSDSSVTPFSSLPLFLAGRCFVCIASSRSADPTEPSSIPLPPSLSTFARIAHHVSRVLPALFMRHRREEEKKREKKKEEERLYAGTPGAVCVCVCEPHFKKRCHFSLFFLSGCGRLRTAQLSLALSSAQHSVQGFFAQGSKPISLSIYGQPASQLAWLSLFLSLSFSSSSFQQLRLLSLPLSLWLTQ